MFSVLSRPRLAALTAAFIAAPFSLPSAHAQVPVSTSHNDNNRTGLNATETKLNVSNVNVARFGKLFTRTVDSKIWCQPLYVPNVPIVGKGTHNVVYVVSENGIVYAFDADDPAQTAPLWTNKLLPDNATKGRSDQNVSSPVIDVANNTIFLTLKNSESTWVFRLFALDIRSGVQKPGSGPIMSAVVDGNAKGSVNGKLALNAEVQKQRPSLLLSNGKIYAAFGGSVDEADPYVAWNGWIMVYDAATLVREQVIAIAPNGNGGGVWQAGNGLSVDSSGSVYAVTGNGNGWGKEGTGELYSFSANTGGYDYGNSIIKMSVGAASGTRPGVIDYAGKRLNITDYWTPYNWKYIETADQDLGSSGLLIIPGTNYAVTGDKIGRLYTLDTRNLGKFQANNNSQIVNDFQAWKGNLHGGMVYYPNSKYGPVVYGWSENDVLKCFKVSDLTTRGASIAPIMQGNVTAPPGMPGGFLSISANGAQSGSAVIWAYTPYEGNANLGVVPGVLRAFDANDITKELWNSKVISSRDDTAMFAKFSNPTVVNGKVYLSSFSNQLIVYGLLPSATPPGAPSNVKATSGIQKISVSWNYISGATTYTVKRGDSKTGPFTPIATNLVKNSYDDTSVVPGRVYYYVVSASNSGGESPDSASVSGKAFDPAAGTVVSVDFNGTSNYFGPVTTMASTEVAGMVAVPNWNVVKGNTGSAANLVANGGVASAASVSWTSEGSVSTTIPDVAGNNRMMKGYLSNDSETPITVNVQNLPATYAQSGYDVYIYCDGVNPTATRAAIFSVGGQTIQTTDAYNRDFEGKFFEPGVANIGNTVIFKNLKTANFTISIKHGASEDTTPRAPINGFQIVAHQSAPTAPSPTSPTNLLASPSFAKVSLNWTGVTGATLYSVKRSENPNGPFVVVGSSQTTNYVDMTAQNGTTYYYVVTAIGGSGESAASNIAVATPQASYAGRTISIDLGGTATAAQPATGSAGYVLRSNWNNVTGLTGYKFHLVDEKAVDTGAAVNWKGSNTADLAITDTVGQARMMRGYLAGTQTAATVVVAGIPSDFLSNGYDIYAYADSNNAGTRTARYSLGTGGPVNTDAAGVQFNSNFVLGNDAPGNMLVFPGQTAAKFTMSAAALTTTDGTYAAPVNGLQIVARNASPVSGSLPTTLSVSPRALNTRYGVATNVNSVYADVNGASDIAYAYLRVGTSSTDTAPLDVYYNGATNKLYVYNGTQWTGGFAPGSANVIAGPRGSLDCAKTVVTKSGTILTVSWNLIPAQALVGNKLIICRVQDAAGQWEQWKNMGNWTVTSSSALSSSSSSVPSASSF